jgi:hypothetical protein
MALTFDDLEPGDFQPTTLEGGLPKLVRIWEHLRDLNTGGYGGAVLVDVKNATSKGKSGVTSCSPFTGTCIYMALDPRPFDSGQPWSLKEPYEPLFDGGKPLDVNFYRLHNSFGLSTYASVKEKKFAGWKEDFKKRYVERIPQLAKDFSAFNFINHSAGSVIALNLGKRVDPKKMRRGDMVGIDWHNGNGHATFCWNVHLDKNGDVDCFQFISSNGTSAGGGAGITLFRYPDVDPAYLERSGGKYKKKKDMFSGIIEDPHAYPEYIQKPYWWFGLPGVKKGDIDLETFGVPAKTVQISHADSMDVSVHEVHVARLHGVTPPEPYLRADGGKTPEPEETSKPAPLTKAKAKKADEGAAKADQPKAEPEKAAPGQPHPVQEELEGHLQTLWKTRWISKDPGDPGSVNDPESQAAIRDYQEKFMKGEVPKPGHADPKTRARIAKAAASAAAMPMVNAALHLAHQRGEIQSEPGAEPMQLDDATRAAVKEFQQKKGLDPDGIPGPKTQEKLSAYMKEASKSAPPQDAPKKDQDAKGGEVPAAIQLCYFVRNHGPAGKVATIKVVTTPACNGKSYSVSLFQSEKELVKSAITVADGKGSVDLEIPKGLAPGSILAAKLSGNGLQAQTSAPFYVEGKGQPSAELVILCADGAAGHAADKLRLGAANGLRLKWSVAGAGKARLTAKSLVEKKCETTQKPSSAEQVSNDDLVSSGLDLPLDAQGSGGGAVLVAPGPCGSTAYTLTVTPKSGPPLEVKATAFVANFNVQLELPDGSDHAKNKSCVLELPGHAPIEGVTNQWGELWLWVPNVTAEKAVLRLLDGGRELASWQVAIKAEDGVPAGALAVNDAQHDAGTAA